MKGFLLSLALKDLRSDLQMLQMIMTDIKNIQAHETTDRPRQTFDFILAQTEHRQLLQMSDLLTHITDPIETQVERRQVSQFVNWFRNVFAYK